MTIEHLPGGVRLTNIGTQAKHDLSAGADVYVELDRSHNPAAFPQYASPADSVWSGRPLAGSAAIGGATGDDTV